MRQCFDYADVLNVQNDVKKSEQVLATTVNQYIDVLVILTTHEVSESETENKQSAERIPFFTSLQGHHSSMKIYILLVHAFNGCVTTSAILGKDKNLLIKSIAGNSCLKGMC